MAAAQAPGWSLVVASLVVVGYQLDVSGSTVLLPEAGRDLGTSLAGVQWAANGFTIALAASILVGGAVADRFGRRRVLRLAAVGFVLSGAAAALAPSIEALVAARAVQGAAAGALFPAGVGLLADAFAGREAPRAFGLWGVAVAVGTAVGPLLAGLLATTLSWRWALLQSAPILLAAVVAARRCPAGRSGGPPLDLTAALLLAAAMAAASAMLISLGPGRDDGAVLPLSLVAAAAAVVALIVRARRRSSPLLQALGLLRLPTAQGAAAAGFALHAAVIALLLVLSVHLQGTLGASPLEAALWLSVVAATSLVAAVPAGRLLAAHGPRAVLCAGLLLVAAGDLALLLPGVADRASALVPALALLGLGLGLVTGPIAEVAVRGLETGRRSVGSGLNSSARQLGASAGVAALGGVAAAHGPRGAGIAAAAIALAGLVAVGRALGAAVTMPTPSGGGAR